MSYKDNYQLLIEKLDQFIRKFYVNQLIRGGLYSLALLLVLFLGLNFLEYHFYFKPGTREALFFSFVGISVVALFTWVGLPLLHYFRLGKVISHEKAAGIIGAHFADVKDKLLNILQLRSQADSNAMSRELILASINQKSEEVKPVPFQRAIDLTQNRRYLKYTLPPLLLLIVVLFAAPSLITDSTARLLKYNKEFEKPAPFRFIVNEDSLSVVQFGEYPLTVKVEGDALPNEAFIDIDNIQYRLTKESNNTFTYRFSNVAKDTEFRFLSGTVESKGYTLNVLEKPNIIGFEVKLDYPGYTGRTDEELKSTGDLVIPAGTNIDWIFNSAYTDNISIRFANSVETVETKRFSDELFTYKKKALKDEIYRLYVSNKDLPKADSVTYSITVVPDMYPAIKAEKFVDSTNAKVLYFVGEAADDYGLLGLSFNYRVKHDDREGELKTLKLQKSEGKSTTYRHVFDLNQLALKPGDEVTYYFEVFDNDGVNGSKSSRTTLMVYSMPTVEEFEKMQQDNSEDIKKNLEKAIKESKKVQEEINKLRDKVLQQKDLDWQTKKELEKLLDRQKELQKQIDEAKEKFKENLENQEQFEQLQEQMKEKQEQMEKLMEETMDDDMKELMQKIEELLQEMKKDEALDKMEEMQNQQEQKEKNMDRMLELYKQLEFEFEMQKTIDKLNELAKEQEKLAEETEKADQNDQQQSKEEQKKEQDDLEKKQEELNKKMEDISKKMEELKKKNEELQNKKDFDEKKEEQESIKQDQKDGKQGIQKQDNQKASRKQKSASKKMKEMAESMAASMQGQEMEQLELDMKALRQLLENIVTLSFEQEDVMNQFQPVEINTPRYITLTQEQKKIQDDFKVVEDSLYALAKRVAKMETFITDKVGDIKDNMRKSLDNLEERQKPQAAEQQQRGMKNLNDLALMLSEVMQQMQMQMASGMPGSQQCSKPGGNGAGKDGKEPKDKPASEGQKELNEGMEKMGKGKKPGEKGAKDGEGGQDGENPTSKEFAQMAARQAAIRKQLEKKQKELQGQGKGDKELQDLIDQMNKVEKELVNKRLSNEMLKRQQDILTRLLEHERAERQRDQDNKRKSETAQDMERKMPPSLEEYIKKREAEIEQFKTVNPALKPYYKNLVEEYYKSLKGTK
ncbi:MAG: DUF4175 domain-containing protein [Saprospiraceae bacterium]|nr:DUF4175 domain-containing protein [Saprospiraceae bacterium]MCF8252810.1 DUF4175 domain-containing protein [Saprospiraceae bacterium]MCF8314365.1 DUF4175 domain-containing protein [Saprospiraceae bacterium]MCF8443237.1 DUF4175 domain-containing protein [Saprospiraceae bacterium]